MLVGAWAAAWVTRALLDWVLGFDGSGVLVAVGVAAVLGGALSIGDARRLTPWPANDRRDAVLGWGFVAAIALLGTALALAA